MLWPDAGGGVWCFLTMGAPIPEVFRGGKSYKKCFRGGQDIGECAILDNLKNKLCGQAAML